MSSNGHSEVVEHLSSNTHRKRSNVGTIDYPRKRTTIACEICRLRKSKCDGNRPKCKLCLDLGADCNYREPGMRLDAGGKLILEQLDRIESMLQKYMPSGLMALEPVVYQQSSPPITNETSIGRDHMPVIAPATLDCTDIDAELDAWFSAPITTNISTMPKYHTNATLHLLRWPIIRDLVPRPYDPHILLQLEMDREPLKSLGKTAGVDLSNTQPYIEAYFEKVNIWYACVNPFTWKSQYRAALSNGFREGPESCIVLLVLALGQASSRGSISRISPVEDPPGMQYFMAAWCLLPEMMTANSVLAAQCHLLAAAYLLYLVRPLEAWNLLCNASIKLQLLLMSPNQIQSQQRELMERVYWNILLVESDLLAELDLPHSGVVQFEDKIGLPRSFEGDLDEQMGSDDLWYFLAEIALRRLLNRVIQLVHTMDTPVSTAALEPIVTELDYQLTQWYENLPHVLQFPFTRTALTDPVQTVLRLKFYACRSIIFRRYVLAVLENEQAIADPSVRENCEKCLESSVRQLEHVAEHQIGHMPYMWQGALSTTSQLLLILGASMSPPLHNILLGLVADQEALDKIVHDVAVEMECYGHLAPSLNLAAEIILNAQTMQETFRM